VLREIHNHLCCDKKIISITQHAFIMKSIGKFIQSLKSSEMLKNAQIKAVKGGDDKRPPRPGGGPGGGTIPPNPLPNSNVPVDFDNWI
jgi:hypothetical protein